jgi:DNA-binding transcriptional ArsR family regulator
MSKYLNMSVRHEQIFRALAEGQRRNILKMLRKGELPAGEISSRAHLTPATVSHHLSVLRNAQLVRMRKEGQQRIYALNVSAVEEAMMFIADILNSEKRDSK